MAQMDELRAAVGRLNVYKAVGIDGVPRTVMKWIVEHRALCTRREEFQPNGK